MIAGDWDPEDLPPAPVDAPVDLSAIRAELEAAGAVDRETARELRNVSEEERERAIVDAAAWRAGVEASAHRAGFATMAEYLEATDPVPDRILRIVPRAEPVGEPAVLARLGVRRLADIPTDPPPPMLVGRCDPVGHTILYGTGGVGKGVLACQWIVELVRDGHVVLIVDYEAHETEWSRRISALGGPDVLAGAYYVAPLTPTWTGVRGPIWVQAADIRAIAEAIGATFVVIDSIVPACAGIDPMKPEAASQYAAALQLIARPALSLAHITKADDQRYPFGSVFWHNLARTTWSLAAGGESGQHTVILTHRKRNNYPDLGKFILNVTWRDGLPAEVWERGYSPALADRITAELAVGPLTVAELVTALNDDLDDDAEKVKDNSVRTALTRGRKNTPKRYTVAGDGTAARWSNV